MGFAEADPGLDIAGVDAAYKLSILAGVAFGVRPAFAGVETSGIRHVVAADIAEAKALGYRVRLLGVAEAGASGLFQRLHAHLVPQEHPLAHVAGSTNAIIADGQFSRPIAVSGRGCGRLADRQRGGGRPDRYRAR